MQSANSEEDQQELAGYMKEKSRLLSIPLLAVSYMYHEVILCCHGIIVVGVVVVVVVVAIKMHEHTVAVSKSLLGCHVISNTLNKLVIAILFQRFHYLAMPDRIFTI